MVCACAAALAVPALALAGSGGGGLSAPAGSQSSANSGSAAAGNSGTPGSTQPGNVSVTSTAGGMSIVTRSSAFLANGLKFSGTAPSQDAGKTIAIERSGHQTNWTWAPTVQARVAGDGSFSAVWKTNHIGKFSIRAVLSSGQPSGATTSADSSDWPTVTVIVYRPSVASWYGDAGSTTACGQVLHKNTLGVANKTLPCGTQVAFYYQGRTITVPVIDRGPYVNGRDWDLTQAAAKLLKIDGVATVGAVSLPRQSSS